MSRPQQLPSSPPPAGNPPKPRSREIHSLLSDGRRILTNAGADAPALTAELLLAWVLGRSRLDLFLSRQPVPEARAQRYLRSIRARADGTPVQYLTGTVRFLGRDILVNRHTLIPRPETELLVEQTLHLYRAHFTPGPVRILDIGTGSGNIAVALARGLPTAAVTAVDISPAALTVARKNARRADVEERTTFIQADLFPPGRQRFHFIVSNPPYLTAAEMGSLSTEVAREPIAALAGGTDGLDAIRRILARAPNLLKPEGFLLLEIGAAHHRFFRRRRFPGLKLLAIHRDFANIPRVAVLMSATGG